jgi:hypothetical protein
MPFLLFEDVVNEKKIYIKKSISIPEFYWMGGK